MKKLTKRINAHIDTVLNGLGQPTPGGATEFCDPHLNIVSGNNATTVRIADPDRTMVYSYGPRHAGAPAELTVHKRGLWEYHLAELGERARRKNERAKRKRVERERAEAARETERLFDPIDDADVFPHIFQTRIAGPLMLWCERLLNVPDGQDKDGNVHRRFNEGSLRIAGHTEMKVDLSVWVKEPGDAEERRVVHIRQEPDGIPETDIAAGWWIEKIRIMADGARPEWTTRPETPDPDGSPPPDPMSCIADIFAAMDESDHPGTAFIRRANNSKLFLSALLRTRDRRIDSIVQSAAYYGATPAAIATVILSDDAEIERLNEMSDHRTVEHNMLASLSERLDISRQNTDMLLLAEDAELSRSVRRAGRLGRLTYRHAIRILREFDRTGEVRWETALSMSPDAITVEIAEQAQNLKQSPITTLDERALEYIADKAEGYLKNLSLRDGYTVHQIEMEQYLVRALITESGVPTSYWTEWPEAMTDEQITALMISYEERATGDRAASLESHALAAISQIDDLKERGAETMFLSHEEASGYHLLTRTWKDGTPVLRWIMPGENAAQSYE